MQTMISLRNVSTLGLFLVIALQITRTTQQTVGITINPRRATTRDKVEFQCQVDSSGAGAVFFSLMQGQENLAKEVARLEIKCKDGNVIKALVTPGFDGKVRSAGCSSMIVAEVSANREYANNYRCDVQRIMEDFTQSTDKSDLVELVIGEPTPSVSEFIITNPQTGDLIPTSGGQVSAGTNVSISCKTNPADPVPEFTISVDAVPRPPLRPAVGSESRTVVYAVVPRSPSVVYRCSVYNTFGEPQTAEVTVSVLYEPDHSEFSIPKETVLQTTEEILICSVANNPPKRLNVAGLDAKLLQPNYPRYEEAKGYSKVFVKLSEEAKSAKELAFTCGIRSSVSDPLKANVQLVAPSSAMMTIGIVIAVVVAVVVIIAVVAFALKKRSAANKASNGDNSRYREVNQNDADRGASRKLDDMPSTAV